MCKVGLHILVEQNNNWEIEKITKTCSQLHFPDLFVLQFLIMKILCGPSTQTSITSSPLTSSSYSSLGAVFNPSTKQPNLKW